MTNSNCLQLEIFYSSASSAFFSLRRKEKLKTENQKPLRRKTRLANDNKYEKDVKTIAAIFPPTLYRWCLKGNLPSLRPPDPSSP